MKGDLIIGSGGKIPQYRGKKSSLRSISRIGANPYSGHKKSINILIIHGNRLDYHTQKAHRLADWMRKTSEFNPIIDKDYFERNKNYSKYQINEIEKTMANLSKAFVRLIAPTSKIGESHHEGPIREIRKAINAGKPIIEIFYQGARDGPNRSLREKNYKYRIPIHIKRGESIQKAIRRGWEIYLRIKREELE